MSILILFCVLLIIYFLSLSIYLRLFIFVLLQHLNLKAFFSFCVMLGAYFTYYVWLF